MVNLKKMQEETAFSTISRDREINKKKKGEAQSKIFILTMLNT